MPRAGTIGLSVSALVHASVALLILRTATTPPKPPVSAPATWAVQWQMFEPRPTPEAASSTALLTPPAPEADSRPAPTETAPTPREAMPQRPLKPVVQPPAEPDAAAPRKAAPAAPPAPPRPTAAPAEALVTSGAGPVSTTNADTVQVQADARAAYKQALLALIEQHKFYPARARRRHQEGRALVAFTIRADGTLSDIRLVESAGSTVLDKAALAALQRLARAPVLPEALGLSHWELVVPLAYRLR